MQQANQTRASMAAHARGVNIIRPRGTIQWGQTVAEFALGLTISALRRIPQTYVEMMESHETWQYKPGRWQTRTKQVPNLATTHAL